MNLSEITKWAQTIDPMTVEEKKRHLVICYKDMIITNTGLITQLTNKIDKYMVDIQEHLEQLDRVGISLPSVKKEEEPVPPYEGFDDKESDAKVGEDIVKQASNPLLP